MITKAGRGRPERIFVVKKTACISKCVYSLRFYKAQAPAAENNTDLFFWKERRKWEMENWKGVRKRNGYETEEKSPTFGIF